MKHYSKILSIAVGALMAFGMAVQAQDDRTPMRPIMNPSIRIDPKTLEPIEKMTPSVKDDAAAIARDNDAIEANDGPIPADAPVVIPPVGSAGNPKPPAAPSAPVVIPPGGSAGNPKPPPTPTVPDTVRDEDVPWSEYPIETYSCTKTKNQYVSAMVTINPLETTLTINTTIYDAQTQSESTNSVVYPIIEHNAVLFATRDGVRNHYREKRTLAALIKGGKIIVTGKFTAKFESHVSGTLIIFNCIRMRG